MGDLRLTLGLDQTFLGTGRFRHQLNVERHLS